VVADYTLEAIDLLETVFVDEKPVPVDRRIEEALAAGADPDDLGPVLSTTTSTDASSDTSIAASTTTESGEGSSSTASVIPSTVPLIGGMEGVVEIEPNPFGTPEGEVVAPGTERLTVLLAGGDAGPDRWSLRTDVMIVATIDLETRKAALIGISRDLVRVPLPAEFNQAFVGREIEFAELAAQREAATTSTSEGEQTTTAPDQPFESCRCWVDRINALYVYTLNWHQTFPEAPDPGMEALRRMLGLLLGIPIDHYVLVDMAGFVDLVDALGGVDVEISEAMDVAFSPAREGEDPVALVVQPGRHHLDGHQALAYVRDRTDSNDGDRMRRQRCMIRALAAEATPTTLVTRFRQIAEAIKGSTTTDIPLSSVPELIRIATSLQAADITTLAIGAPSHSNGYDFKNLPIVDPRRVRETVAGALSGLEAGESFADNPECPQPGLP
jgi:LCP family protein required for cell wall assembly